MLGFVFSDWAYDIPKEDPGQCPEGMNITDEEFFSEEYAEVREEVEKRWNAGDRDGALELLPEDACKDPAVLPDPGHILLRGQCLGGGHRPGRCELLGERMAASAPTMTFVGVDGVAGIDNQHYRLMGCVKGFRPDGLFDRLFDTQSSILENGFSPLLEMKLVEGTPEAGRYEVRLFTSAGPVTKDANNNVVPDMSQLVHEDTLYHSEPFPGQIKDGVFTAGPVDAKLRFKVQAIDNHYYFKDLQIRADILPDGSMKGVLAGYWDIENTFDFLTEVYIGPIHLGRAAANNIGYMCSGVYHALPRVADGHPDPETGKCTSMSTVVKFAAVPAFVIQQEPGTQVAQQ